MALESRNESRGHGDATAPMSDDSTMRAPEKGSWYWAAALFAAALSLFCINLSRPPHPDELHHVLAAQRLLETGLPLIGTGAYWRGIAHTWLVALSYEAFGESIASARIPALIFVALVVPILFLWVRREAGSLAAWLTAILFISSPFVVEIAQFSRFYALQMFCFTLGALCLYYALAPGRSPAQRLALLVSAGGSFVFATWLQLTTVMGLIGVGTWAIGSLAIGLMFSAEANPDVRRRRLLVIVAFAVVLAVIAVFAYRELGWMLERFRTTPLFAAKNVDEFWYYHIRYHLLYPTLWPLVGLFAVLAVIRSSRLGWMAATIFGVSFVLASFAAQKGTRYICFAQPFLAIVWGVGLAQAMPAIRGFLGSTRDLLGKTIAFDSRAGERVSYSLLAIVIAMVFVTNPFWLRTATMIGNVPLPLENPTTDWAAAREALAPWTAGAEIMVTTEELGAIYFLGRSDVRYSPNKLAEIPEDQRFEFGIDHRIGRPVISRPESLERLIQCFRSGIVVGPIEHWGNPILISEPVQDVIRRNAQPIAVPKKSHLYAWGWTREAGEVRPASCAELDRFSGLQGSD